MGQFLLGIQTPKTSASFTRDKITPNQADCVKKRIIHITFAVSRKSLAGFNSCMPKA